MALGRGQGLVYIGQSINSRPSDQTDLKEWRRYNLGGDGKPTYEREADRWGNWADRPVGGVGWPHMSCSCGLLPWVAF
jgi:hypothetical protein